MSRIPTRTLLTVVLPTVLASALAASASAGEVYQWKDAKGVTHYSEAPPANGKYVQRETGRDAAPAGSATVNGAAVPTSAAAPKAASAPSPAESVSCTTARSNLAMLEADKPVQIDSDGDGKPDKTLDDTARNNQRELARAQIKANCAGA